MRHTAATGTHPHYPVDRTRLRNRNDSEKCEKPAGSSGGETMATYDPNNIFAKMLKDEIPCHKIYEDEDTLAFLDIMPRSAGHALVITKEPAADLFAVSADGLAKLMAVVQKLSPKIKQAVGADGVLIQQFNGAAAGQTVFHLHVHIVPVKEGVALKPHAGDMADQAELTATAENIRKVLSA
jgi:histidine triad (HIT) family protein